MGGWVGGWLQKAKRIFIWYRRSMLWLLNTKLDLDSSADSNSGFLVSVLSEIKGSRFPEQILMIRPAAKADGVF